MNLKDIIKELEKIQGGIESDRFTWEAIDVLIKKIENDLK